MVNGELLARVMRVYEGSDGDATVALYAELGPLGPVGVVAVNVFRAQKASERAKRYRGGRGGRSYRSQAYEKKQWSMENLAKALLEHAGVLGIRWGWAVDQVSDALESPHRHVLYVDLPTGQISWHTASRSVGPDYPLAWDGARGTAPARICAWVAQLLEKHHERA